MQNFMNRFEERYEDQIGVAILGCGYWGINYVRVFSELPEARVVVVCDQDGDRLEEVGRRFPRVSLSTDLENMLQMPDVDVVVICTGATSHYQVARRCLIAGKHVLIEKPITTTASDAEELIVMAETQQRTLMVGHTFLYNAGIQKIKACIERESVGDIYYLYARRTNLGPIRRDVNALWDLAPHDISIFNYLLDSEPEWVSAVGTKVLKNCREDVGFVSLGYPNGVIGNIHVSWVDPNKVRELVVVGSEKRIVFDDTNNQEPVRVFQKGVTPTEPEAASFGEYQLLMRDGDITSPRVPTSEPLKNLCRHFIESVEGKAQPITDGTAGLEVVRVMEAIDRSIAQNGIPVKV